MKDTTCTAPVETSNDKGDVANHTTPSESEVYHDDVDWYESDYDDMVGDLVQCLFNYECPRCRMGFHLYDSVLAHVERSHPELTRPEPQDCVYLPTAPHHRQGVHEHHTRPSPSVRPGHTHSQAWSSRITVED